MLGLLTEAEQANWAVTWPSSETQSKSCPTILSGTVRRVLGIISKRLAERRVSAPDLVR